MNVQVKLFMGFRRYLPPEAKSDEVVISLPEESTVNDLLNHLEIPGEEQKLLVINGVSQGTCQDESTYVLKDGDVVSVFPPVGGG